MISEALRRCFEDERIEYAVVANVKTGATEDYSGATGLAEPTSSNMFRTPHNLRWLNKVLSWNSIFPKYVYDDTGGWVLFKPEKNIIIGLFTTYTDSDTNILWGTRLSPRIMAAWKRKRG